MAYENVNELDAEITVAGSILIDQDSYRRVSGIITADCFQSDPCRTVFRAAAALAAEGKVIDAVSVSEWAQVHGSPLDSDVLIRYMELTPTSANDTLYAEIVRDHARRRQLLGIAGSILSEPYGEVNTMVADTLARLEKLASDSVESCCISSPDAAVSFYTALADREKGKRSVVPTGYEKLDKLLGGGFLKSGLYIIAARPGVGKTTFAINLADSIKGNVLFVSLEMSPEQITARRVSRAAALPATRLVMDGGFDQEDWKRISAASAQISENGVFINQRMGMKVSEINILSRSIKNLTAIIIDYLGLIRTQRRSNRYEEVTEISGELKRLAVSLNVPIIALAQLNRQSEQRADKAPHLADLRDSGALEQDADGVILLSRPEQQESKPWSASPIEVNVAKNRHAGTGKVMFNAFMDVCRIVEM